MRTIGRLLVLVLAVLSVSLPALAQRRPVTLRSSMVVTTDWLADHLRDPSVVVLHVARNKSNYDAGHIPGARFLSISDIAVKRNGMLNELAPVPALRKAFERVGAGDNSRIILYGEMQGLLAARAYFTLDYLGHGNRAALLDGGLEKWRLEERPVTSDAPHITAAVFTPHLNPKVLVKLPEIQKISRSLTQAKSTSVLLDARPEDEYSGEKASDGVKRAGHIPGATNLYWMETIESKEDPELTPPPDVRKFFAAAGATGNKRLVTYCRTGIQASFLYFVAKFLGYETALYDGSFIEWSNAPDTQVANGTSATPNQITKR